jgi:Putative Actinobacterial Holin-X, holin superfamily III
MPTSEAPQASPDSIAAIGRQVAEDAARLVRDEIALAKAEASRAAKAMAVSVGLFVASGVCLTLMFMAGLGALADGLGNAIFGHAWIGWVILCGLFLVLALFIGLLGYRGIRKTIGGGKRTVTNIKEDVEWLKQLTKLDSKEI